MTFNPGRNVGRVSIRAVPDTRRFRPDLKRNLDTIEKTTTMTVRVDKAKLDRFRFKQSLQRQLATLNDLDIATKVAVTVDSAKIRHGSLRKSIQDQFDEMSDVRVWIRPGIREEDRKRFHHAVRSMVNDADSKVDVGVNAHTLEAAAQLRYTTRPRVVEVFARVNKASLAVAAQSLSAMSGAGLTWSWLDNLAQMGRDLDKNLPKIVGWTSGITSLVGALGASVAGIVGIGQGLVSITPAFLALPGLILNAAGSVTVLIVALKSAKEELAVLGSDMTDLGKIIRTAFWDNAREPIINLVQGLMPQLRNAFRELSTGVGQFTGALADAFGRELGGGRLESIFSGIAEGWRILATGADGFAGALTSLSNVAAKYTPRLASWFVRQANTFDHWLDSISNDGRLESWMEGAIKSMYDLWDATTGVAGTLEAIWKAADLAGSDGLAGFADMMQEWKRVTNGADFQRGLTAIFRGSYVAMEAFGGAVKSLGRLVLNLSTPFERFIGSTGGFLGGLLDAAFKALNNSEVARGINDFAGGLDKALAGITPSLDPIAKTVGGLLSLIGTMASTVLPTAVGIIADLTPYLNILFDFAGTAVPLLTDALGKFADVVAPAFADWAKTMTPVLIDTVQSLGDALVRIAPSVASILRDLAPVVADLVRIIGPILDTFDLSPTALAVSIVTNPSQLTDLEKYDALLARIKENGGLAYEAVKLADEIGGKLHDFGVAIGQFAGQIADAVNQIFGPIVNEFASLGQTIIDTFQRSLEAFFPGITAWFQNLGPRIAEAAAGAPSWLIQKGAEVLGGFLNSLEANFGPVGGWFAALAGRVSASAGNFGDLLYNAGKAVLNGFLRGLHEAFANVKSFISGIGDWIVANKGPISYDRRMLVPAGRAIMYGLNDGLTTGFGKVRNNISGITNELGERFVGGGAAGATGGGNVINITQPLLPGETPKEQRDNLARELRWAV